MHQALYIEWLRTVGYMHVPTWVSQRNLLMMTLQGRSIPGLMHAGSI